MTKLIGINTVDCLIDKIPEGMEDHYVFQIMVSEVLIDPQDLDQSVPGATFYVQSDTIDNALDYLYNEQSVVECDIQSFRRVLEC